jgi:hypothetical protein
MATDVSRGIYRKFKVTRTDGSSRKGKKHHTCSYFILDLAHDPFCRPALRAYAKACRKTHPHLAADILDSLSWKEPRACGCREAMCPHTVVFHPPMDISIGRKTR